MADYWDLATRLLNAMEAVGARSIPEQRAALEYSGEDFVTVMGLIEQASDDAVPLPSDLVTALRSALLTDPNPHFVKQIPGLLDDLARIPAKAAA